MLTPFSTVECGSSTDRDIGRAQISKRAFPSWMGSQPQSDAEWTSSDELAKIDVGHIAEVTSAEDGGLGASFCRQRLAFFQLLI